MQQDSVYNIQGNKNKVKEINIWLIFIVMIVATTFAAAQDKKTFCGDRNIKGLNDPNISSSYETLNAIATNNETTVAVGFGEILVSKNSVNWSLYEFDDYFKDVLWDEQRFVALTEDGKIYASNKTGSNWALMSSIHGDLGHFQKLVFSGEIYMTVSEKKDGDVYISYSDTGVNWKTAKMHGYHHYGSTTFLWSGEKFLIGPASK